MNKILTLVIAALTAISCNNNRIVAEGEITTLSTAVEQSANIISVENAMHLTLTDELQPGTIVIATHANIQPYITVSKGDNGTYIGLKKGKYKKLNIIIKASSQQYSKIEASGASDVTVKGDVTEFENYSISLSGASKFSGKVEATNTLSVNLSGASKVYTSGTAAQCNAKLSGASKLYDKSFTCDKLNVDISGASKIEMSVNDEIKGGASGASTLAYKGNPTVSVDASGASSIKNID